MKLTSLPGEVLADVMRLAGQPARVQSMLACKALSEAASAPGVWASVIFSDLDLSAVRFMERHRCAEVSILSDTPDDIAWFLNALTDSGMTDCIKRLRLDIGRVQRLPEDLLCAVSRHGCLEQFTMFVDECEVPCELIFPRTSSLSNLRKLTIVENSMDVKNVVVFFCATQPRFTSLEEVHIDVGMSDLLDRCGHLPHLRRVTYHFDMEESGETYENAELQGLDLDLLEMDVNCETDLPHLCRELEKCTVRRLVLHVCDDFLDLSRRLSPALEELVIGLRTPDAEVLVDFPFLAEYPRLRALEIPVTADWILGNTAELQACEHSVVFQHVPNVAAWTSLFGRVALTASSTATLTISPH